MGTVGLSFGSATSGTGFDVASTVSSILAVSSAIETPWKTQLTALQAQDTALTSIGSNLSALSTAVSSLTSFDGVLASKQGSSSDPDVLTLTAAGTSAVAGSHTVVVTSLAQTSSQYSGSIAHATDTLSGSLSIQVGTAAAQTLTLNSSINTLSSLAAAINSGSYGVSASLVTDTSGSRLSLVSQTSGAAGAITLTPSLTDASTSTSVGFSVGQSAADAHFTVDGLPTTSASNTVTGAIPGVTFQLLAAAPSTQLQVQIANDNSSVESAVQSLVTAYNSVVTSIKTQEGKDSTGAAEPLYGSTTLALIQSQLSASLLGGAASGSINNIAQLGLSLGEDGILSLKVGTLDSTLNSSFSDVAGFLQNSASFGQNLSTALNSLGSSTPQGAIALALAQDSTEETGLNADVTAEDALLATQKTTLTAELTTANQVLQSIPSQLSEVNQIYSAITGYNETQS